LTSPTSSPGEKGKSEGGGEKGVLGNSLSPSLPRHKQMRGKGKKEEEKGGTSNIREGGGKGKKRKEVQPALKSFLFLQYTLSI